MAFSSRSKRSGFTLIELLTVISIISLLSAITLTSLQTVRERARLTKAKQELSQIRTALQLYLSDSGGVYPADATRNIPNGIEAYLSGDAWPNGPWERSVYDWENWPPEQLDYPPYEQVYQISIRFCDTSGECNFPDQPWIDGSWNAASAAYYCISGPCRAHSGSPVSAPGKCLMGACPQ